VAQSLLPAAGLAAAIVLLRRPSEAAAAASLPCVQLPMCRFGSRQRQLLLPACRVCSCRCTGSGHDYRCGCKRRWTTAGSCGCVRGCPL
jgi:hypothetical protein